MKNNLFGVFAILGCFYNLSAQNADVTVGIYYLWNVNQCGNDQLFDPNPEPRWLFWVGYDGGNFTGPTCSNNWGIGSVACNGNATKAANPNGNVSAGNLPRVLRTLTNTTATQINIDAETWEEDCGALTCNSNECIYNSSCGGFGCFEGDDRDGGYHYSRTRSNNINFRDFPPCQDVILPYTNPGSNTYTDHRAYINWIPLGQAGTLTHVTPGTQQICIGTTSTFAVTGLTYDNGRQSWRIVPVASVGSTAPTGAAINSGTFDPNSASPHSFQFVQTFGTVGIYMIENNAVNPCTGAASSSFSRVWVDVRAQTVAGTLAGPAGEVCLGGWNPGNSFNLTGQTGTIVRWERQRIVPAGSVETVNGAAFPAAWNSGTFTEGTWRVRVYVQNSPCGELATNDVFVTVVAATVAGTLTVQGVDASGQWCANGVCPVPTVTLTGNVGNVIRWERSLDGGPFEGVDGATFPASWCFQPGFWVVRVRVQAGSGPGACPALTTSTSFTAILGSIAGTIAPLTANVCLQPGELSAPFVISGSTGNVKRWERRRPGSGTYEEWVGSISDNSPLGTFDQSGLWFVRAIVENGSCGEDPSEPVIVNVNANPTLTVTPGGEVQVLTPTSGEVCRNRPAQLIGGGGSDQYQWTGPGGFTASTAIIAPSTANGGTFVYQVVGTNTATGCQTTATYSLIVRNVPTPQVLTLADQYCNVNVDEVLLGSPAGGTFSGPGVVQEGALFFFRPNTPGIYTITYSGTTSGCPYTTTFTTEVAPTVSRITGLSIAYCVQDNTNYPLSGEPAGGTFAGPGVTNVGGNWFFNPSAAGIGEHQIQYSGIDPNLGCEYSAPPKDLIVLQEPVGFFLPLAQTEYCETDATPVTLEGAPPGGVFSGPGVVGNTFVPNQAGGPGTYTLTYTGAQNGCEFTTTRQVSVGTTATAAITGLAATYCASNPPVVITGSPAGGTFSGPGVFTGSGTNIFIASFAGQGTHTITYSGTLNGCAYSTTQTVNVVDVAELTFTPDAPEVCVGNSRQITVSGGTTYTWSAPGAPNFATGGTQNLSPAITTTYSVTSTTPDGCSAYGEVTLTVRPFPTVLATAADAGLCTGESTTLSASGAETYEWFDSDGLSLGTGATLNVSPTAASTTYSVVGTISAGCSSNASVTVTVSPPPTVTVSADRTTICLGEDAILTAVADVPNSGLRWLPGSVSGVDVVTVSPIAAGTFTYTVIADRNGCERQATVTITVVNSPDVSVSADRTDICAGQSVTLTATGPAGLNYIWQPGNLTGQTVIISPPLTTVYILTATDPGSGCSVSRQIQINVTVDNSVTANVDNPVICAGQTATLTASGEGALTYTWSTPGNPNFATGQSVSVSPTTTTIYSVVGVDVNGCGGGATVSVTVNELPAGTISQNPPNPVCAGTTVNFSGSSPTGTQFVWNPGGHVGQNLSITASVTQAYTLTVSDANNCSRDVLVTLDVLPSPNVTVSSTTAPATVTVNMSGGVAPYDVTLAGITGSGAPFTQTQNNLPGPSTTFNNIPAGTYTVTVQGANGCRTERALQVFAPACDIVLSPPPTQFLCAGQTTSTTMTVTFTGGVAPFNITWAPAAGLSSTTGATVTANPTTTTIYTVNVEDVNGCARSATVEVRVSGLPVVSATTSRPTICIGESATLTAFGASSYEWYVDGNLVGTGTTLNVSPSANTVYTVRGVDANQCSSTGTVTVNVSTTASAEITASLPNTLCTNADDIVLSANPPGGTFVGNGVAGNIFRASEAGPGAHVITYTFVSAAGCTYSTSVSVNVVQGPIGGTSGSSNSPVCIGGALLLTANEVAGAGYLWTGPNGFASSERNPVRQPVTFDMAGTYQVRTVLNGCVSDPFDVPVVVVDQVDLQVGPENPVVCRGSEVFLSATGAEFYEWSPATWLSHTAGHTVTAAPRQTVTYTVTGFTGAGCVESKQITVTVKTCDGCCGN